MKKNKIKLRGTKGAFISVTRDERVIWNMTDEEWASLNPYWQGKVSFNDLPPAAKRYVKSRNIKPSVPDIIAENSAKSK